MKNDVAAKTIWLMGPTSSGKTTLSEFLLRSWRSEGRSVMHFDGDEVRDFFGQQHGFSKNDRLRVVKTLVHLANKATEAGMLCIVSALTANENAREYIRNHVDSLILVYIDCSIEECARRDPKGLYERAKKGEIDTLVGWNSPYVPPSNPDLVLNTERFELEDLLEQVDNYLQKN